MIHVWVLDGTHTLADVRPNNCTLRQFLLQSHMHQLNAGPCATHTVYAHKDSRSHTHTYVVESAASVAAYSTWKFDSVRCAANQTCAKAPFLLSTLVEKNIFEDR